MRTGQGGFSSCGSQTIDVVWDPLILPNQLQFVSPKKTHRHFGACFWPGVSCTQLVSNTVADAPEKTLERQWVFMCVG